MSRQSTLCRENDAVSIEQFDSYHSVSLLRGFAVLESFAYHPVQGITEIAERLTMSVATVHRYVRTLISLGYLEQDQETKRYRLVPGLSQLGAWVFAPAAVRQFMAAAPPGLLRPLISTNIRAFAQARGETVSIAVLDDLDILYIDRAVPPHSIDLGLHPGSRLPAYCTALGKALLSVLEPTELLTRMKRIKFNGVNENANSNSFRALTAELHEVRRTGIAVNNDELRGVRSIAVTIPGTTGKAIAAINLVVHPQRYSVAELIRYHAPSLIRAARSISVQIVAKQQRAA